MSPADRRVRKLFDRAGLVLVIVWPVACVVAAVALWLVDA